MRRHFKRTALSVAAAQAALLLSGVAMAQSAPAPAPAASAPASDTKDADSGNTIVVTGRRAALQSSQKIKQESDEIVDSVVAEEIGKLPDRSVTEVLQRVPGVTIDRTMAKGDPEHYSVEGSGVNVRGLSLVRSELNGRDTFSANGGRTLNFEDVPPELMAGVDVYKNPSAEQIEGAIGGLVNLRTAMPFDFPGFRAAFTVGANHSALQSKTTPTASGLISNRWDTDLGQFGALLSLAHSESKTRSDTVQSEPYFLIDPDHSDADTTRTVWAPRGVAWRSLEFERKRDGIYGALQWKKNDMQSSLSYFQSKYKMKWNETALFGQAGDPYKFGLDPGYTVDANNVLLRGTLREVDAGGEGGVNFGADTRYANRNSDTKDFGWNFKWKVSDRWSVSTDLQYVRSKTNAADFTVGNGVLLPSQTVDLTGSYPQMVLTAADQANLLDPSKNYWGFTMEHFEKSKATSKAWRGDAMYKFEDPVLQDLRFGVRLTDREAVTTQTPGSYHWAAITQTWQRGWAISDLAYLSDPRFAGNTYVHNFNNFFGGKLPVASAIMPVPALAQNGYPAAWQTLHGYAIARCEDQYGVGQCPSWTGHNWSPSTFGTDPIGSNDQHEKSQAAYAQLRFGFDDWKFPVDGNVGLRVVRTDMKANGFTVLTIDGITAPEGGTVGGAPVPTVSAFAVPITSSQQYTNVLPSLNLKMKAAPDLQFRLGWAQAIARPDFSQMQAYTNMKMSFDSHTDGNQRIIDRVNLRGEAQGNPELRPTKSNQLDLTAEWYFSKNGSFTVALFNKQLKDIIVNQTSIYTVNDASGNPVNFTVTSPVNGAKGHARGFELAFQRYFDMLPGWLSGFGVQANYTYIDSKTKPYNNVFSPMCSGSDGGAANLNLRTNGCDTDGRAFGNMPLANLSRNAYNIALLYDYGPVSARLAYSWRSKYLQAVYANGTNGGNGRDANGNAVAWALPTWNDDYGQLDGGINYKITDNLSVSLEGQNLTNAENKQLMQQHIGMMTRAVFHTGRRYSAQMSYSF